MQIDLLRLQARRREEFRREHTPPELTEEQKALKLGWPSLEASDSAERERVYAPCR